MDRPKLRDPVERLDQIVTEIERLSAEADRIIDNYVDELVSERLDIPRRPPFALN